MAKILDRFQNWLVERRSFMFDWMSSDQKETSEPEESLAELPSPLGQKIAQAANQLPSNPHNQQAIQSALQSALKNWSDEPQKNPNSLIILSSPLAGVSRILSESLEDWQNEIDLPVKLLDWVARPTDPEEIKEKMQHQLGRGLVHSRSRAEIVVIPNLSWCFLRCVEGLEGIDYLRDVLLQDYSRFWIIGCGQVGWEYLDHVSSLKSFCGETLVLPKLSSEQLESWLQPMVEQFEIEIQTIQEPDSQPKGKKNSLKKYLKRLVNFSEDLSDDISENVNDLIDQQIKHKKPQSNYFKRLADISEGISTVAVQVFLESICCLDQPQESDFQVKLTTHTPRVPPLAELEANAHYILYALLLHGDLTLNALATSLGDDASIVQGRVQLLRRKGIIEQQQQILKINPIHYPRLKEELANNNFIIKQID